MKDVGVGVDHGAGVAGGRTSDRVVVSVSVRRSLLARWRARFSAEAAGMVVVVEDGWEGSKTSERSAREVIFV